MYLEAIELYLSILRNKAIDLPEPKFKKDGYSLYQFVATVAREKLESDKVRLTQSERSNN